MTFQCGQDKVRVIMQSVIDADIALYFGLIYSIYSVEFRPHHQGGTSCTCLHLISNVILEASSVLPNAGYSCYQGSFET